MIKQENTFINANNNKYFAISSVNMPRKYTASLLFIFLTGFCCTQAAFSQEKEYVQLAYRSNHPKIFVDVFALPGNNDGHLKLTTIFQLSYKSLSFKKVSGSANKMELYGPVALSLQVFKSSKDRFKEQKSAPSKRSQRYSKRRKGSRHHKPDVEGLQSVGHTTWKDTAYAANYKQTQSSDRSINGSMQMTVQPGYYTYLLKMEKNSASKRYPYPTRTVHVSSYNKQKTGDIFLVKEVDNMHHPTHLTLINMGKSVPYSKDFYAFIHLPRFSTGHTYSLKIDQVQHSEKDTTQNIFKQDISDEQILQHIRPQLRSNADSISLALQKGANGYTYVLVKIPNHTFPNASYQLTLTDNKTSKIAARGSFQSYWRDMPTSLLNLDVAIKMLKYIVPKDTVKKLNSGSAQQRKHKLNQFWEAQDPTPGTQYNELEATYYARIDSAYNKFTSNSTLGFNSDRGQIYIKYGPPKQKKRIFPTNGPSRIIWTYPSRKFIFKATSGFGDYKLMDNSK
jgi:GWxTD domain-containing protein